MIVSRCIFWKRMLNVDCVSNVSLLDDQRYLSTIGKYFPLMEPEECGNSLPNLFLRSKRYQTFFVLFILFVIYFSTTLINAYLHWWWSMIIIFCQCEQHQPKSETDLDLFFLLLRLYIKFLRTFNFNIFNFENFAAPVVCSTTPAGPVKLVMD